MAMSSTRRPGGAAGGRRGTRPSRRRSGERSPPGGALTVAVTGAAGTIGSALVPQLAASGEVGAVTAVTRRGGGADGSKVRWRRADLRDRPALDRALAGADVVVHLAYSLYGVRQGERSLYEVNVEGTLNAFRAAVAAGARRFVYSSSAAVYGFWADRPGPVAEDAALRPPARHFYARHRAEAEARLTWEAAANAGVQLTLFRPCAIVGPHAAGAATRTVPWPVRSSATAGLRLAARLGLRPAIPGPPVALQFVHEVDVASALLLATLGKGAPGAYNLAGDGAVEPAQVPAVLGLRTLPVPRQLTRAAVGSLRTIGMAPYAPEALGWGEVLRHPLLLDTAAARERLGWRPRFSSREALADTGAALGL